MVGRTVHLHLKLQEVLSEEAYYTRLEKAHDDLKTKAITEFDTYLRQNNISEMPVGTAPLRVTVVRVRVHKHITAMWFPYTWYNVCLTVPRSKTHTKRANLLNTKWVATMASKAWTRHW